MTIRIETYGEVLESLREINTKHLLLGNGFSIGCDPVFSYGSLYEAAKIAGLSDRAQQVFETLGTNNFEGVMHLLENIQWAGQLYGLPDDGVRDIQSDIEIIKETLVQAVSESHLDHSGLVNDEKKAFALEFLSPYKNVFTTNYDLLLYWIDMSIKPPPFGDGFRPPVDEPDSPYLVFTERLGGRSGMFYLHGALHLYLSGGELRKHSWVRTGLRLTELIRASLEEGEYPLFVAEGTPEGKLEQIQRHGYLWYCLDKLARIKGPLVVYGHALGPSDAHIVDTLADNVELPEIIVGLYENPANVFNQEIIHYCQKMIARRQLIGANRRGVVPLTVRYFQSETAKVWGP